MKIIKILKMGRSPENQFLAEKTKIYLKKNNIPSEIIDNDETLGKNLKIAKNNWDITVVVGEKNIGIVQKNGVYKELNVLHNLAKECRKRLKE